jgi:methanesulfonate monooxygenase small subunit
MPANSDAIRKLIGSACMALDAEDYARFLALCAPKFHYQLLAYSPEIRTEMIWMNYDRKGLETLFADLPHHLHVPLGTLFRHVSVYSIDPGERNGQAAATSSLLVIHTDPDGVSKLFAAARYADVVDISAEQPLLIKRTVRLETRDIGSGTPIPL